MMLRQTSFSRRLSAFFSTVMSLTSPPSVVSTSHSKSTPVESSCSLVGPCSESAAALAAASSESVMDWAPAWALGGILHQLLLVRNKNKRRINITLVTK